MGQDLSEQFEHVRRAYFPRWDRGCRWRVQYVDDLPSMGLCENPAKTISINLNLENIERDELWILLIHESCHAITRGFHHSKPWRTRMLKAADVALGRGDLKISDGLRKQIDSYQNNLFKGAYAFYWQIKDWFSDRPDAPYERTIEALARRFGMYRHELEHRCKRCRQVYEKAHRRALRDAKGFNTSDPQSSD